MAAKYQQKINDLTEGYYRIRAVRVDLEREVAKHKRVEDEAYAALLRAMQAAGVEEAQCTLGPVRLEEEPVAKLTSWPELCAYIHKYRAYELLQKRLTLTAVREHYEAGETIPGVTVTKEPVLKFSRP